MKSLLLSATALALCLTAPAFAAPHDHGDRHDNATTPAATPAAPAMIPGTPIVAPAHGRGGDHRGGGHHGAGGANNAAPVTPANNTPANNGAHRGGHNNNNNNNNNNNGANTPFGGGGDHRGGHAGRGGHNSVFDAFRRAFNAPRHYHHGTYHRPSGYYAHRWTLGEFLPALFFAQNYWIDDYSDFDLSDPPDGTHWVRYGNDALLIDEDSGEVIQVVYGIFY